MSGVLCKIDCISLLCSGVADSMAEWCVDCQPAKVDADYFGEMDSDSDDAEIQPQEVMLRGCIGGELIAVAIDGSRRLKLGRSRTEDCLSAGLM